MKKFLFLLLSGLPALGLADTAALQKALEADLLGKTRMLRGFFLDQKIIYDSALHPVSPVHPGSWTLANIEIAAVTVSPDHIEVSGKRVGYEYDYASKKFLLDRSKQKITIEIEGHLDGSTEDIEKKIRAQLFLWEQSEISEALPEIWKRYFEAASKKDANMGNKPASTQNSNHGLFHVGHGVTPPKPIYTPDPESPRSMHGHGEVTVLAVVIDDSGNPRDIVLEKPVGLGFDENAIEAVRKWRFEPAKKDGKPVSVAVNIEVSFND